VVAATAAFFGISSRLLTAECELQGNHLSGEPVSIWEFDGCQDIDG